MRNYYILANDYFCNMLKESVFEPKNPYIFFIAIAIFVECLYWCLDLRPYISLQKRRVSTIYVII